MSEVKADTFSSSTGGTPKITHGSEDLVTEFEGAEVFRKMFEQDGLTDRGDWANGTAYAVGDLISSGYRCVVAHTSGVWSTDLANGYWVKHVGARKYDLESSTGAGLIGYKVPDGKADTKTLQAIVETVVKPEDFTGSTEVDRWTNALAYLSGAGGGFLWLRPNATYELSGEVSFPSNVGLFGNAATIKLTDAAARLRAPKEVSSVRLVDFLLDCDNTASDGIILGNGTGHVVRGVRIKNSDSYSLTLDGTQGANVDVVLESGNSVLLRLCNGAKGNRVHAVATGGAVASVKMEVDSTTPDYDATLVPDAKSGAVRNWISGIFSGGSVATVWGLSGHGNRFAADVSGASTTGIIYLTADTFFNDFDVFLDAENSTGYGVYTEGLLNRFRIRAANYASLTAVVGYRDRTIVDGLYDADGSGTYITANPFDGGVPADLLYRPEHEGGLKSTTLPAWTKEHDARHWSNSEYRDLIWMGIDEEWFAIPAYLKDAETLTASATITQGARTVILDGNASAVTATLGQARFAGERMTIWAKDVTSTVEVVISGSVKIYDGSTARTKATLTAVGGRVVLEAIDEVTWAVIQSNDVTFT